MKTTVKSRASKAILAAFATSVILAGCDSADPDARFSDDPLSTVAKPIEGDLLTGKTMRWSFVDKTGWLLANQGDSPETDQSSTENHPDGDNGKVLKIFTRAHSRDRKKLMTPRQYGSGLYTWRCYIGDLGIKERTSIGSWLWHDDEHELDFEVGSGTTQDRNALKLADDEVIAYITSQDNPKMLGKKVRIKKNAWHTFQKDIKLVNGNYFVTWFIDGVAYIAQQLEYGEEYPFYIFCSVENLNFVGDHLPLKDNFGLWDYVEYTPYAYSMAPINPGNPEPPVDVPETDPGETTTWTFNGAVLPTGWDWGGTDGCGGAVQGGFLNMPNKPGCTTSRITYADEVGYGKYTWKMRVPALAGSEKFMAGGTLYNYNDDTSAEHAGTIAAWYGSEADRSALGATADQLVLRVYWGDPFFNKSMALINPNQEYELAIELKDVNGKYHVVYSLDGVALHSQSTSIGEDEVKFSLIAATESDRGWQPGAGSISQEYTAKFSKIAYTKY